MRMLLRGRDEGCCFEHTSKHSGDTVSGFHILTEALHTELFNITKEQKGLVVQEGSYTFSLSNPCAAIKNWDKQNE